MKPFQFTHKRNASQPLTPALAAAGAIVDEWLEEFDLEASRRVDLLLLVDDKVSIDARRCV